MIKTEDVTEHDHDLNLIPRLNALRRVPARYRSVLPLPVMKRYQCLVIGGADGMLTVAISDRLDKRVLTSLRYMTGQAIFPVFVDSTRMRLLIQRLERNARVKEMLFRRSYRMYVFHPRLLRSFLSLVDLREAEITWR